MCDIFNSTETLNHIPPTFVPTDLHQIVSSCINNSTGDFDLGTVFDLGKEFRLVTDLSLSVQGFNSLTQSSNVNSITSFASTLDVLETRPEYI